MLRARMDADLHFASRREDAEPELGGGPRRKNRRPRHHAGRRPNRRPAAAAPLLRVAIRAAAALVRYSETPLGRLPTQIDYSDYRDADGVKLPYRWSLARPGNRFTIQVDELHQNVPVDDAKFIAPPPPPPPEQKPAAH